MKTYTYLFTFCCFSLLFSSCWDDSSPFVRQDIPVAPFHRIEIKADVDIFLHQDNWLGVIAEGPSESLNNLEFIVDNGELIIRDLGRVSKNTSIEIHVPDLTRIEHDCHGDLISQNSFQPFGKIEIISTKSGNLDLAILGREVEVRHRGDGEIKIEGEADFLDLKVNDSGNFLGFNLISDEARVKLSDDGLAEVNVKYDLDATINGHGDIFMIGFPDTHLKGNGTGQLIDVN